MISKKIKVRSLEKALFYLLVGRNAEIVDASPDILALLPPTIDTPDCVKYLAELLSVNCDLRPDVVSPFRHWSLAIGNSESVDGKWKDINDEFISAHGLERDKHSFLTIRHLDQGHDHVHPVFCRVGNDGSLLRDVFRDCAISQAVCRRVEKKYGLRELTSSVPEVIPVGPGRAGKGPRKTRSEKEMEDRRLPTKKELARARLDALWPVEGSPLFYSDFSERLAADGIDVLLNKKGDTVGVSYCIEGEKWKACTLGEKYQWKELKPHIRSIQDHDSAVAAERKAPGSKSFDAALSFSRPREMPSIPMRPKSPKVVPSVNLLALLEEAYESQGSLYQREEQRRAREGSIRAIGPKDRGIPFPGGGPRPGRKPGRRPGRG